MRKNEIKTCLSFFQFYFIIIFNKFYKFNFINKIIILHFLFHLDININVSTKNLQNLGKSISLVMI